MVSFNDLLTLTHERKMSNFYSWVKLENFIVLLYLKLYFNFISAGNILKVSDSENVLRRLHKFLCALLPVQSYTQRLITSSMKIEGMPMQNYLMSQNGNNLLLSTEETCNVVILKSTNGQKCGIDGTEINVNRLVGCF